MISPRASAPTRATTTRRPITHRRRLGTEGVGKLQTDFGPFGEDVLVGLGQRRQPQADQEGQFTAALEALLNDRLAEHERLKQQGKIVPLLFHRNGQPIRTFRGSWITACRAAAVPGRLLHDLRRTAVRSLERAGVSRSAAMAMVGNKTEAIYRRYAIVDAGSLRDAARKIDNASGTPASNSALAEKRSA